MITTILIVLWVLIGFLSMKFSDNAWKVYWYKKYHEHYDDTKYRDGVGFKTLLLAISLGGVITFFVVSIDGLNRNSEYYYPNSLWMIRYNKQKVEEKYGK